jgi:hypothetical protein
MSNLAIISIDSVVRINDTEFKISEYLDHAGKVYDATKKLHSKLLTNWNEIGVILINIKSAFGDNLKGFGVAVQGSPLGKMARQDRTAAIKIASNWTKVQTLNKDGALDNLGLSAIVKRLDKAEGKGGAGVRKMDQTASPKGDEAAPQPKAVYQTEADLAAFVLEQISTNGLDRAAFIKALTALCKKGA